MGYLQQPLHSNKQERKQRKALWWCRRPFEIKEKVVTLMIFPISLHTTSARAPLNCRTVPRHRTRQSRPTERVKLRIFHRENYFVASAEAVYIASANQMVLMTISIVKIRMRYLSEKNKKKLASWNTTNRVVCINCMYLIYEEDFKSIHLN